MNHYVYLLLSEFAFHAPHRMWKLLPFRIRAAWAAEAVSRHVRRHV